MQAESYIFCKVLLYSNNMHTIPITIYYNDLARGFEIFDIKFPIDAKNQNKIGRVPWAQRITLPGRVGCFWPSWLLAGVKFFNFFFEE